MNGTRTRAAVALLLAAITGSLLTLAAQSISRRYASAPQLRIHVEDLPGRYRALDLTTQQEERIRAIVQAARPATDSILLNVRPRLNNILAGVDSQVRTVLTPAQIEKLNATPSNETLLLKRKTRDGIRVDTIR